MSDPAPLATRRDTVLAPVRRWASNPERAGRHLSVVPVKMPNGATPVIVATAIVLVALFALAASHAVLIKRQTNLDRLNRDVAIETELIRGLRLDVALLEAPDRLLATARHQLGMVTPTEVGYLLPANAGLAGDPVRVTAAELPPEPADPEGQLASPEQAAVDAEPAPAAPSAAPSSRPAVVGDRPPPADEPADRGSEQPSDRSSDVSADDDTGTAPPPGDGTDDSNDTPARPAPTGDFDLGDG